MQIIMPDDRMFDSEKAELLHQQPNTERPFPKLFRTANGSYVGVKLDGRTYLATYLTDDEAYNVLKSANAVESIRKFMPDRIKGEA